MNVSPSLLSVLQRSNESIVHYETLDKVIQANAEGNRILVSYEDDKEPEKQKKEEIFVKQIVAGQYHKKKWADLRRTLLYARTEVRFYKEFVPEFQNSFTPKCYHAEISLEGVVGEDEKATDVNHPPPKGWPSDNNDSDKKISCLQHCAGYLILRSMSSKDYIQESPISLGQATKCLEAVAEMHASSWENVSLLQKAAARLSEKGGSYHLHIRNPAEHQGLTSSWDNFRMNFQHLDPSLFAREEIVSLGKRIYDLAEYVSEQLSPSPNDPYATIVHGDYKAMNVFLPVVQEEDDDDDDEKKQKEKQKAIIIDFASTGLGFGMSDVAMHIPHAVHPSDLANGGEEQLLNAYLDALQRARQRNYSSVEQNAAPLTTYPKHLAIRHYKLASIDYFRFVLGRFWKTATVESFEKKKDSDNVTFPNRNVDSAFAFIKRVESYLSEFENEYAKRSLLN